MPPWVDRVTNLREPAHLQRLMRPEGPEIAGALESERVAGLPFLAYLCQECIGTAYKRIDLHG